MTPNVHLIERDTNDPGGRILGTGSSNHGLESHIELTNGSLSSHYFESPLMSDYPDNVLVDEPTFESWMPNMDASIGIDLELLEPIADSVLDIGHSPTDSYTANSSCEFNMHLDESIATQYIKHDTLLCFEMVSNLAAMYEHQGSGKLSSSFEVKLGLCDRFSSDQDKHIQGRIQGEEAQLVGSLMDKPALKLYVVCTIDAKPVPPPTMKKRARNQELWPCTLDLAVYGPMELFDGIGNWFQTFGVYL
ncbi:hypothetical protein F4823DRAFT_157792 [Ustulina deusta]|nr:hypothetical protein F4823DRAFT_157792 [Ustulina deusta]